MLSVLLLATVFDPVYFWLSVELTNCLFDLEQAKGSLDRSYLVQLIPFPASPSFSIWMSSFASAVPHIRLSLHSLLAANVLLQENVEMKWVVTTFSYFNHHHTEPTNVLFHQTSINCFLYSAAFRWLKCRTIYPHQYIYCDSADV